MVLQTTILAKPTTRRWWGKAVTSSSSTLSTTNQVWASDTSTSPLLPLPHMPKSFWCLGPYWHWQDHTTHKKTRRGWAGVQTGWQNSINRILGRRPWQKISNKILQYIICCRNVRHWWWLCQGQFWLLMMTLAWCRQQRSIRTWGARCATVFHLYSLFHTLCYYIVWSVVNDVITCRYMSSLTSSLMLMFQNLTVGLDSAVCRCNPVHSSH